MSCFWALQYSTQKNGLYVYILLVCPFYFYTQITNFRFRKIEPNFRKVYFLI